MSLILNPYSFATVGGGGGTDPDFASVVALLHMEGANGSTTFTDQKGHTFTASGAAQISTAQSRFGSSSMANDGDGDWLTAASSADFGFGAGDFTVEGWYYRTANLSNAFLVDFRVAGGNSFMLWASQASNANKMCYSDQGAGGFTAGTNTFPLNTWAHWALTRSGTTVRGFIGGVLEFTTTDSRTFASPQGIYLGSSTSGGQGAQGYMDEFRVTKGVARYTAAFTPPTAAFPDS